jgi:hypothetical protein
MDLGSSRTRAVVAAGAALWALAGCHMSRILVPSIGPVDPVRPTVRYPAIQGRACEHFIFHFIPTGANPLVEATWEMQRLENADGYVQVTVEDHLAVWFFGHSVCTTVTGYPFTYGTEPKELRVRGAGSAQQGAPMRPPPREKPAVEEPPPGPPPVPAARELLNQQECASACAAFGKLAGATELIQRVVAEKCQTRCLDADRPYFQCVKRAREAADVKTCNALPAPEP